MRGVILAFVAIFAVSACGNSSTRSEPSAKERIARTNTELGLGYLQQGERKLAIEKLQKAIDADASYAPAQHSLALAYQEFGQMELAERHYRIALKLPPQDGGVHNNFGAFLCGQGRFEEGEAQFRAALLDPAYATPATALENAGLCALRVPDLDKAENYLRQALKVDANMPGALLGMAHIQFERKQYLNARGYLQRYETSAQLPAQGLWVALQVERQLGDTQAAQRYMTQLYTQFPDSSEAQRAKELEMGGSK